jgi:hypothetical protein
MAAYTNNVLHSFVQLGFSSNVTLDTVALTNFVRLFNFCGRLYSLQSSGQTFEHPVLQQKL